MRDVSVFIGTESLRKKQPKEKGKLSQISTNAKSIPKFNNYKKDKTQLH